jgi:hypothetical protein
MTDPKNPSSGSGQGEDQKNQNERAGQRRDQAQPGQGQSGQSGERDRASNPQGDMEQNRPPKPGQPSGQNTDR